MKAEIGEYSPDPRVEGEEAEQSDVEDQTDPAMPSIWRDCESPPCAPGEVIFTGGPDQPFGQEASEESAMLRKGEISGSLRPVDLSALIRSQELKDKAPQGSE